MIIFKKNVAADEVLTKVEERTIWWFALHWVLSACFLDASSQANSITGSSF